MEKCLQCSKALQHVPGRKQKSFCDVNCRNKYFYAKRKKESEDARVVLSSQIKITTPGNEQVSLEWSPEAHKKARVKVVAKVLSLGDEVIRGQIKSILDEKCPKERDTPLGRKSWALEQKKRIEDLEKQIK